MSQNRFLSPDSNNIVEVSTDDELSNTLGAERNGVSSICHPRTPEHHCSICLDEFTNRCHTNVCDHVFCFECLKRWSSIDRSCPVCKKRFRSIIHSLSEYGNKEYDVPLTNRNLNWTYYNQGTQRSRSNFQDAINAIVMTRMEPLSQDMNPIELNDSDSDIEIIDESTLATPISGNDSDIEIIDSFNLTNPMSGIDSDVEMIDSFTANPSKDLPSTSTGIRDSLDRPINRMIVDSSSSDDVIEPGITAVARKRERKIRKTKPRKKRIVEDSKTDNRIDILSYPESSVSSCDTD